LDAERGGGGTIRVRRHGEKKEDSDVVPLRAAEGEGSTKLRVPREGRRSGDGKEPMRRGGGWLMEVMRLGGGGSHFLCGSIHTSGVGVWGWPEETGRGFYTYNKRCSRGD